MKERRNFSRVPFKVYADFCINKIKHDVAVMELSLKGALISKPVAWGRTARRDGTLKINLIDEDITIEVNARIIHEKKDSLGLYFMAIDVESVTHLRRLMELNVGDALLIDREITRLD